MSLSPSRTRERVPVRTIAATIGMVLATVVVLFLIVEVRRTLVWLVVAAFFAVALYPVVNWVQRRLTRCRRSLATLVRLPASSSSCSAASSRPSRCRWPARARRSPTSCRRCSTTPRPAVGRSADCWTAPTPCSTCSRTRTRIRALASGLTTPAAGVLRGVATGIAGAVTIFVLSYLMVLEGPKMVDGTLSLLSPQRAERIRRVGPRLRQVHHRLHLGQPADQRHLRRADLHRAEGHAACRSPG